MLLTRTVQHLRQEQTTESSEGASSGGSDVLADGGGLSRRELAVQLLLFLQVLEHWVIAESVKAGEIV